ncbi:Manganese/iron superoxide dismutase [Tuber indicum]|nr:Manganese/iron superoxide dismutase [Tuber indicum]
MSVPLTLRRQALRAFPPLTRKLPTLYKPRSVHSMPVISLTEKGVPGLFSEKAFKTAWTDYQKHLVEKLGSVTAGKELDGMDTMDIAIATARQPDQALIFNYASQAYNNHFFFQGLRSDQKEITPHFGAYVTSTFTSVDALKAELFATANAMFGNGYVWLVLDQTGSLRILCTYNAGTPYGASYRRQDTDTNTGLRLGSELPPYTSAVRNAAKGKTGGWVIPVLNVNVWEHAWLEDFGILGKDDYLNAWWEHIDWVVVQERFPKKNVVRTPMSK